MSRLAPKVLFCNSFHMLNVSATVPTPSLSLGETVIVAIEAIGCGGEGVGRFHDFVIFIPFVIVGEEVEVEITEVKKRFARGRLLRVLKPSPDREVPLCRYFGDCGGCQYQHI